MEGGSKNSAVQPALPSLSSQPSYCTRPARVPKEDSPLSRRSLILVRTHTPTFPPATPRHHKVHRRSRPVISILFPPKTTKFCQPRDFCVHHFCCTEIGIDNIGHQPQITSYRVSTADHEITNHWIKAEGLIDWTFQ